jgi:glucose/arabinose dehydrogenase
MGIRFCFSVICFLVSLAAQAQTFNDANFISEKVVTLPVYRAVGFAFAPDGRLFIWQKDGVIKVFKSGVLLSTPFLDISARVNSNGDRGLIGFAFDPAFSSNGTFYVAYVYESESTATKDQAVARTQRVSRFQVDPANPDLALKTSETVILGKIAVDGCTGVNEDCSPNDAHEHTIDHIVFAPDGKLFVSLGDGGSSTGTQEHSFRSQNLDHLNGKLLRINKDGSAPSDNPFYNGSSGANRSKVWAYGLRNPYRFALHLATAEPYIGDVGWYSWEEIDRGKGKNFGWPCFEGGLDSSGNIISKPMSRYQTDFPTQCSALPSSAVTKPLYTYAQDSSGGSITMGTFFTGSAYPSTYLNNLFFADYVHEWIRRLTFDSSGNVTGVHTFATNVAGPVYLSQGPDGMLYYMSFTTGEMRRIRYTGTLNHPPVAVASASPTSGYAPLDVQFTGSNSSDPDGNSLTYSWNFGDGTTSTSANAVHRYSDPAVKTYIATLTVKDPSGLSSSASVNVTVGSLPPQATIFTPVEGTTANVGDVVNFSGAATDPDDGNLPGSALSWTLLLHHNTHIHTVSDFTGSSGSFTVEDHDSSGTYYYELVLTARDSSGLTNVQRRSIDIRRVNATLSGKVINAANGTGVSGFTVSYSGGSTTTDTSGNYRFSSVVPGTYTFTANRSGWLSASSSVTLQSGSSVVLDLRTATAGKIIGKVTNSSGVAIAGATINMQGGVLGINRNVTSNSTGNYDSGWIAIGTYTFAVSASGFVSAQRTVGVSTGVIATQNFALSTGTSTGTGTLQGKVTDVRNGAALAGAAVSFSGRSTLTDSAGYYKFTSVAGGSYNVTASKTGYLSRTLSATVSSGATTTLNIPLSVAGKIAGYVRTASGAAISGATVTFTGGVITTTKSVLTNTSGFYDSSWIPVGTYTVTATKSGVGTKTAGASVSTGQTTTLNFSF